MSRLRKGWPVAAWLAVAVMATLPFWNSDLDLRVARLFFHPGPAGSPVTALWPVAEAIPSRVLYATGSAIAWLVVLIAGVLCLSPRFSTKTEWRRLALILLATVTIGPGLLVNGIGKDFTGRPRPRQLVEFGGPSDYRAPWQLGTAGVGKSFPCGHCSVGFAIGAVGIAIAQARPWLGSGIVFASILLGGAIGIARMAAGAHFLSDVLWAALLSLGPGAIIARSRWRRFMAADRGLDLPAWRRWAIPGTVGLCVVGGLLFARPFHARIQIQPDQADLADAYIIELGTGQPTIELDDTLPGPLQILGEVQGFGFPNVEVISKSQLDARTWHYRLAISGWTSEVEAPIIVRMRPDHAARIHIRHARVD